MKASYKQAVLLTTKDGNSVMVAPLQVLKETSLKVPKDEFQVISHKKGNRLVNKKLSEFTIDTNKLKFVRVKDYQTVVHGYVPQDIYQSSKVAPSRSDCRTMSKVRNCKDVLENGKKIKSKKIDTNNIKKYKRFETFGLDKLFRDENMNQYFRDKKNGNLLWQRTLERIILFKTLQDLGKCVKNFQHYLHNTINKIDRNKNYLNKLYIKRNTPSHQMLKNKIDQLWHFKHELIKFDKFIYCTKMNQHSYQHKNCQICDHKISKVYKNDIFMLTKICILPITKRNEADYVN